MTHRDRQTHRHTDRHTNKHINKHRHRLTLTSTPPPTCIIASFRFVPACERASDRRFDTHRHTQTHTKTFPSIHTHTHLHTHTHTHTHTRSSKKQRFDPRCLRFFPSLQDAIRVYEWVTHKSHAADLITTFSLAAPGLT